MNFPGVIAGDPEMLARDRRRRRDRRVDGHAPGLTGPLLDAYLAAGVESDHESTPLAEAEEKRRKGMWVFMRQGSASQNLVELDPRWCCATAPTGSRSAPTTASPTRSASSGTSTTASGWRWRPACRE